MRQMKLTEFAGSARSRVTRGNSDLPKEEPKPVESESEESEEESSNPPKEKKIHHMTLKAMERKRKMAEEAAALGISLEPKEEVPKIPKKRGRPKGYRVKKVQERDDFQLKDPSNVEREPTPEKKEFTLRKRDPARRFVDEDSEALQRQLDEMAELAEKSEEEVKPMQVQVEVKEPPKVESVVPTAPKKRGRKKKVVVEVSLPQPAASPAQKLFTVPKIQTYDNYNKYYDKLMEVRNEEDNQFDQPLIFNKFLDPDGYESLLDSLR